MDRSRLYTNFSVFIPLLVSLIVVSSASHSNRSMYKNTKALRDYLLSPDNYSTEILPISSQGEIVNVSGFFELREVVSVNRIQQELVTSGYFSLRWKDSTRSWNPSDYGGISKLNIASKDVWKPHLRILNAVEKRDPFQDEKSYLTINNDGETIWRPVGIIHTTCELDKYIEPACKQHLCPTYEDDAILQFEIDENVHTTLFVDYWKKNLISSEVTNERMILFDDSNSTYSCITIHIKLSGFGDYYIFLYVIPFFFLSTIMTCIIQIPFESGENVGSAVTLLLTMCLSHGTISGLLQQGTKAYRYCNLVSFSYTLHAVPIAIAVIWVEHLYHRYEVQAGTIEQNRKRLGPKEENIIRFIIWCSSCCGLVQCKKEENAVETTEMGDVASSNQPKSEEREEKPYILQPDSHTGCYIGLTDAVVKTFTRFFIISWTILQLYILSLYYVFRYS